MTTQDSNIVPPGCEPQLCRSKQTAESAYFTVKQMLHFGFAELIHVSHWGRLYTFKYIYVYIMKLPSKHKTFA